MEPASSASRAIQASINLVTGILYALDEFGAKYQNRPKQGADHVRKWGGSDADRLCDNTKRDSAYRVPSTPFPGRLTNSCLDMGQNNTAPHSLTDELTSSLAPFLSKSGIDHSTKKLFTLSTNHNFVNLINRHVPLEIVGVFERSYRSEAVNQAWARFFEFPVSLAYAGFFLRCELGLAHA
jgi:hypothetical protein